jgi:zinc protease
MTTTSRINHLLSSLLALLAPLAIVSVAPISARAQTSWQQIPIPPLPAFHPAEPKRIALPTAQIFLQEDHELPLIDGSIHPRRSQQEPAAKVGLPISGEVWRTGGTKTQTGDQMDDYLESAPRGRDWWRQDDLHRLVVSESRLRRRLQIVLDLLHKPDFRAE